MHESRNECSNPILELQSTQLKYLASIYFAVCWSDAKVALIMLQALLHKYQFVEKDLEYGGSTIKI